MPICDNLTDDEEELMRSLDKQVTEAVKKQTLRLGQRYSHKGISYEVFYIELPTNEPNNYRTLVSLADCNDPRKRTNGDGEWRINIGVYDYEKMARYSDTLKQKQQPESKQNMPEPTNKKALQTKITPKSGDDQVLDDYRKKDGTQLNGYERALMKDAMERARTYEID